MTDYAIVNVRIYVGNNTRGQYMWALSQLYYEEDEYMNPATLPTYPIMREATVKKWLKCAVLNNELTKASNGKYQIYDVNMDAVYEAIKTKQFKDGSKCCKLIGGEERTDDFAHIRRVEAFDKKLTGLWAKIALTDTKITLNNGREVTIPAGQPLVGKNGIVVPVTSIRVHVVVGLDGKPIESIDDVVNGILERRYIAIGNPQTQSNAPGGAPAEQVTPEENDDNAKKEQEVLGLPII